MNVCILRVTVIMIFLDTCIYDAALCVCVY